MPGHEEAAPDERNADADNLADEGMGRHAEPDEREPNAQQPGAPRSRASARGADRDGKKQHGHRRVPEVMQGMSAMPQR